jgi:predicted nucleotidyltransferase
MANDDLTKRKIISSIEKSRVRLASLGVKSIGLFGSFVREQASRESDVDLLVEFDSGKKTYDNFIDTCFLLEELLGRRVELVTKDSLSPYIKPYILKEVEYVTLSS